MIILSLVNKIYFLLIFDNCVKNWFSWYWVAYQLWIVKNIIKKDNFYGQMVWRKTLVVIRKPFSIIVEKVTKQFDLRYITLLLILYLWLWFIFVNLVLWCVRSFIYLDCLFIWTLYKEFISIEMICLRSNDQPKLIIINISQWIFKMIK